MMRARAAHLPPLQQMTRRPIGGAGHVPPSSGHRGDSKIGEDRLWPLFGEHRGEDISLGVGGVEDQTTAPHVESPHLSLHRQHPHGRGVSVHDRNRFAGRDSGLWIERLGPNTVEIIPVREVVKKTSVGGPPRRAGLESLEIDSNRRFKVDAGDLDRFSLPAYAEAHGHLEFGSPVTPMTLEAEVLYWSDNASAKTTSMADVLQDEESFPDGLVSTTQWTLDRRRAYRGQSDWGRESET